MVEVEHTIGSAFPDRPFVLHPTTTPSPSPKEVPLPSKEKEVSTVVVNGVLKEVYRTLPYWRCFLDLKHLYAHTPVVEKLDTSIASCTPCQTFAGVNVVWAVSTAVLRVQTSAREKEVFARRRAKQKRLREDATAQDGPRKEDAPWCSLALSPLKVERRCKDGGVHPVTGAACASSSTSSSSLPSGSSVFSSRFPSAALPSVARESGGSALHAGWVPSAAESKRMKSWRGVPSRVCTFHIGTLHFVHQNATAADERSFHIQSVFLYDQPHRLQCVAGMMVHFALVLYSSSRLRMEVERTGRSLHSLWKEVIQPCAATEEEEKEEDQRSHLLYDKEDPSSPSSPSPLFCLHGAEKDVPHADAMAKERGGRKKGKKKGIVARDGTRDEGRAQEARGEAARRYDGIGKLPFSSPSNLTPPPPPPPPPPSWTTPASPMSFMLPEERKRCVDVATPGSLASRLLFPPTTRVLILGMGGNSMAVALRGALGPQALIHVVEIEPSVVDTCLHAGTALQDDPYCHVFVQDAKTFLEACLTPCPHTIENAGERPAGEPPACSPAAEVFHTQHDPRRRWEATGSSPSCAEKIPQREEEDSVRRPTAPHPQIWCGSAERGHAGYHMIFLDLFEPLTARMVEEDGCLLQLCYQALCSSEGGLLVANEHQLPDPHRFIPLTELFGDGRVHAVNVRGWKESVVVGWKAPSLWPLESSMGRGEAAQQGGDCPSTSAAYSSSSLDDIPASLLPKKEEVSDVLRQTEEEGEERMKTKISLTCTMHAAKIVQCVYDRHVKEILPDVKTWLSSVSTCGKAPHRCRIWES